MAGTLAAPPCRLPSLSLFSLPSSLVPDPPLTRLPQSMVRAKAARKLVHEMRCQKNSILIQAHVRGFLAKRQFQRVRNSAIVFQVRTKQRL